MADKTISVDFIAKSDKFVSPVDQMNKQLSKMDSVASYAKKSLITLGVAAVALGVAFLVPKKYVGELVSAVGAGFAKIIAIVQAGAGFISEKMKSALGTSLGTILKSQLAGLITIPLAHLAIGGAAALGGMLTWAAKQAISFDAEMRNTNTILGQGEEQFRKTKQSVIDLSMQFPIAANDLAKALYHIASAGFTKASDSSIILKQAALGAVAGITDVATSGNALVTVLNSYGLSARDAAHVTDVLFQAVKQGQFTFPEMAGQISDFTAIAKLSGTSLEETFAAYSMISVKMGDAAAASTALRGVFSALVKESPQLANVIHALGFESSGAMIKQLGLVGTLKALHAAVNGNAEAMADLFPEVRALNGALAIATTNAQSASETLHNFTDNSKLAGAAQRAYDEQTKTVSHSISAFVNTLKSIGIEVGTSLLPILKLVSTFLGNLLQLFQSLPRPVKDFSGVILAAVAGLTVMGAVMKLISTNTAILKIALEKIGSGSVVGGVKNIASGMESLVGSSRAGAVAIGGLRTALTGLASALGPVAIGLAIVEAISTFSDSVRHTKQNVKDLAATILDATEGKKNLDDVWTKASSFNYQGGFGGLIATIHDLAAGTKDFYVQVGNIDQALALLVKSGNAGAAQKAYDQLIHSFKEGSPEQQDIIDHLTAYGNAMKDASVDQRLANAAQDAAGNSVDDLTKKYAGLGAGLANVDDQMKLLQEQEAALGNAQKELRKEISSISSSPADAMTSLMNASKDATKDAKAAAKDMFAVEKAQYGITKAEWARVDAEKALAAEQGKNLQFEVMKAERAVGQAYDDNTRSILRLEDAMKALEELRHPSGRSISDAEQAVGRATDSQAAAVANVALAQEQLNQARDHGTPAEIATAERNLRDATWNVNDATNALADAQKKLNDLTKNTPEHQRAILLATLDVADANRAVASQQDNVRDSTTALSAARQAVRDQPNQIARLELAVKEALLGEKEAHQALTKAIAGPDAQAAATTFDSQQKQMQISAGQFKDELEKQIKEHQDYWNNITIIAERYGPAVAKQFIKLGINSSGVVADMAKNISGDMQGLANDMIKNAVMGTEAFQAILAGNMSRAPGTVRTYTQLAAQALAQELGIGVEEAKKILDDFGLKLQDSTTSYMKEIPSGTGTNATPSFRMYTPGKGFSGPTFQAEGDVINGHQPQISHSMRVWAEPETGGEAYIPLAPGKRKRSEKLLQQVAGIFGMQLYAQGGIALPSADDFTALIGKGVQARLATPVSVAERTKLAVAQELQKSRSVVPSGGPTPPWVGGVNQWASVADQVAAMLGQPGSQGAILRRISFESGGNPTSVNTTDINWIMGHPSVGLAQVIAGTFASYAGQFRGVGPYLYGVSVDPLANVYAGMAYATSRYGSIAAVDPLVRPVGYDRGGWLPPRSKTLALNNTSHWEPVGPPGGGGSTYHVPVKVEARIAANVDLDHASRLIGEQVKIGVDTALDKVGKRMIARNGR